MSRKKQRLSAAKKKIAVVTPAPLPANPQPASVAPASTPPGSQMLSILTILNRLPRLWLILIWSITTTIFAAIIGNIVTQFQSNPALLWPAISSFLPFILILIFITIASLFWHHNLTTRQKNQQQGGISGSGTAQASGTTSLIEKIGEQVRAALSVFIIPIVIPAVSSFLLVCFLLLTLIRPIWCPAFICPLPQTIAPTHPGEVSDQNLEAYFSEMQKTFIKLPGPLKQNTLQSVDQNIAAIRSDDPQTGPYRLFISIHNRHQTGEYLLYIYSVALIVNAVPPLDALYVANTPSFTRDASLYHITYSGQPAGSQLDASYEPVPSLHHHQFLADDGDDTIGLQIDPAFNLQADLQFYVDITYSLATEIPKHTIRINKLFEVAFSNANNWHPQKL